MGMRRIGDGFLYVLEEEKEFHPWLQILELDWLIPRYGFLDDAIGLVTMRRPAPHHAIGLVYYATFPCDCRIRR